MKKEEKGPKNHKIDNNNKTEESNTDHKTMARRNINNTGVSRSSHKTRGINNKPCVTQHPPINNLAIHTTKQKNQTPIIKG